jgi:hypothetical protein
VASLLNEQLIIRAIVMTDYERYIRGYVTSDREEGVFSFQHSHSSLYHPEFPPIPCLEYFFSPVSYPTAVAVDRDPDEVDGNEEQSNGQNKCYLHPPFLPFMLPHEDVITQVKIAIFAVCVKSKHISMFVFFFIIGACAFFCGSFAACIIGLSGGKNPVVVAQEYKL